MNQLRQLLVELYRKKIIIVLCAVLCAAALAFEKYYFGEFVVRTGTYYTTAVVHVDHLKENDNSLKAERLLRTTENLYSFIEKNEKNGPISFNRLDANWDKLNKNGKITWLQKYISIYNFGYDTYEILIKLDSFVPKDANYLKANSNKLLHEFIACSDEFIQKIEPSASIRVIKTDTVYPEVVTIPKKQTVLKYGMIGFILGLLLSSVSILIWTLGRKK
ncbi:MAG: hypothetical protein KHX20_10475 [Megasphaera sp.]|uniref:hypothetical protein n=1 Tax=Acidaminococcus sp. TaxID=1872103 RepID=UPI002A7539FC|nr:hypothetical protein [Acidaminococcus sp.]MBS5582981.1 hypothetical protein [Megasphaera sp.]MDY2738878.1 hypothetical protein [Acidaminococcus sp.]